MRIRPLAAVCALVAGVVSPGAQAPGGSSREAAYRASNVGVALLEQFDYEAAAASFRQALKLDPALDAARLNLAIALLYGGDAKGAAGEASTAADRLPSVANAHYVLGLARRSLDELDGAALAFRRVLEIDGTDAGARVNLGQIALQRREYDTAIDLFRGALDAEPYNVTAAYSLALALTRSGKADEGRKAMAAFEALRDSLYGVTYAQTYLAQGKYAEAIVSTGAEPALVDPATPSVTFSDATSASLPAKAAEAEGAGGVTLFDADDDGDLDAVEAAGGVLRFLRNDRGTFTDETVKAGLAPAGAADRTGALAADYDNDGRIDLLVLRSGGPALLRQNASGGFEDATRASGLVGSGGSTAAFADVDHDGDLDVVLPGSPTRLFRNSGNGTFGDIAVQAGTSAPVDAVAVAATDYDNRRDIDFFIASARGPLLLYRNLRDGTFRNAAADVGLPAVSGSSALAVGDINKDGFTDLFIGGQGASARLAMSDGQGRFRVVDAPAAASGSVAAQFVDYDNDGLLDLLAVGSSGARLFRSTGVGQWVDVSEAARLPTFGPGAVASAALALGDVDLDGDTDVMIRLSPGGLRLWKNGGTANASLRVRLAGRVSNRSGVGSKIEMRAGSLRQLIETTASAPAAAPADAVFGLGRRTDADVVRVLWPSGILQAEIAKEGAPLAAKGLLAVAELDRKPSSCPYLFTWNGKGFEFVTDFLGGAEMGAWLAPGVWNVPDPDEYVRIPPGALAPRDGRYELRVTNELEEALFVDRLQLVAVDHAAGVEVYPNEGLRSPPRPPFAVRATRDLRPPRSAVDEHGHDVTARIAALDRQYVDDFAVVPIRGYAEPHTLTLDLGTTGSAGFPQRSRGAASSPESRVPSPDAAVLLLTGWTDYAFSNDNVAASQRGLEMAPPSVQVRDASGRWRTVIKEIGFPVGRPQTVVVSLKDRWLSPSREVRITTNMRIYWDQILVDSSGGAFETRITRVDPASADLRWRGFSAEVAPDGREPFGYDYSRVSTATPWMEMIGRYTREGDVAPLLRSVDDMYVVSRPGDELAISFDERLLPPLAHGQERTFLVYAYGWSKEMNPRSAAPETVAPLPFSAMTGYPYGPAEHYPRGRAHREYQERYNTRVVGRAMPSIDGNAR